MIDKSEWESVPGPKGIIVECWECHTPIFYKGSCLHPIGSQIWVNWNPNNQNVLGKYFHLIK